MKEVLSSEEMVLIFKALANETRLIILQLLKEPDQHFRDQHHINPSDDFDGGICVGVIQEKINLSQSTTSQYLALLQTSGLLETKRIGQWTYYRRNEDMIKKMNDFIQQKL